jgi:hypothetical protein
MTQTEIQERIMTIQAEQETRRSALARISDKLDVARAAIKEAEAIAKETGVGFDFEIGGGDGYFYVYKDGEGYDGYWDGWQGSQC